MFLASGAAAGESGPGRILIISPDGSNVAPLVEDPELSPLDLTMAPNGHLLVSSEVPFASPSAVGTIREYDSGSGRLLRVFTRDGSRSFRGPRGLRLTPDGRLCCVAQTLASQGCATRGLPSTYPRACYDGARHGLRRGIQRLT